MASVQIRDVVKNFGDTKILHGVSVDIADGEFAVLVGPSGCGKSTLLRMIAGLEEITGGSISIGGREVNQLPPKERDIAMVFQNYALYPHMTVFDNMAFSLKLAKVPRAELDKKVARAAEILGLQQLLERYPRQLSGGQRQRVAMGRAIVRNPQVFLFDEPLSNLDAKLRVQMRTEIRELHQNLKSTSVYVTHDQIEAMTMADKIVVMRDGHIQQVGSPLELYDWPANVFVAGFIGSPSMNFLPATAVEGGDKTQILLATGDALTLPYLVEVVLGQPLLLGLRPECCRLEATGDGVDAEILVIEPTGADTVLICRVGKTDITVVLHQRTMFKVGDRVKWLPDLARAHLFNEGSGERVAIAPR
ncbi:MAG: sn-glycerol-3-phosphate ABC transporter ATP-binding protein UgpC [Proteobacteria bacterium]|nr:sn-glycerol-3-phosphate ABC transporter ATP-binding protein UgpC [Pseudomonadota bacterium]